MKAFLGEKKIKQKYLERLKVHVKADELIHGKYWENGKGCAVGCTIHSSNHMAYETKLGIPVMLARLEDAIFENLENGLSKEWPIRFLSAIKVGTDLSMVGSKFLHWLLVDPKDGVIRFTDDKTRQCVLDVGALYERRLKGDEPTDAQWAASATRAAWAASAASAASARTVRTITKK